MKLDKKHITIGIIAVAMVGGVYAAYKFHKLRKQQKKF